MTLPHDHIHRTQITIERSQFITHLARTDTETRARQFIEKIRKEHAQATHNCTAFYLWNEASTPTGRSHDDGEPAGTAGAPMLHALTHSDLYNVTAVVTRYFGGIKLGKGGLVDAYSSSVSHACDTAPRVIREKLFQVTVITDFSSIGRIESFLRNNYIVTSTDWTATPSIHLVMKHDDIERCHQDMARLSHGNAQVVQGEAVFHDRPVNATINT